MFDGDEFAIGCGTHAGSVLNATQSCALRFNRDSEKEARVDEQI